MSRNAHKVILFFIALLPLIWLLIRLFTGQLGANPIEATTRYLGEWGLILLLLTLSISPLRRHTPLQLLYLRRMLGLFSFSYLLLHLLSYIVLDQFFDWSAIFTDIIKRPYITFGMVGMLLLLPLAVTSTNNMMRRLGKNWQRLHKAVYLIAIVAIIHYILLTKADLLKPLLYTAVVVLLLGERLWVHYNKHRQSVAEQLKN